MEIYIPKSIIHGSNDNNLNEESYYRFCDIHNHKEKPIIVDELPTTTSEKNKQLVIGSNDFYDICNVYKLNIQPFPSISFQKAYSYLMKDQNGNHDIIPPWNQCMPKDMYKKELSDFIHNLKDQSKLILDDLEYYHNVYRKHDVVFNSLQPAKISSKAFIKALGEASHTSKASLGTFAPQEFLNGYTKAVRYLRNDSATGRLKVREGYPEILTISKEIRNSIIESRFGTNGSIYYLDFKSLEPRVLLSILANINNPSYISSIVYKVPQDAYDIYQNIIDCLGISLIPRNAVKLAILMVMYGASEHAIIEKLREQEKIEDVDVARKISNFIHEAFGIEQIKAKYLIPDQYGRIYNYYGRPISVIDIEEYKFINYFIQSTAVEVSLFGFANIINKLHETKTIDKIVPLFVIHDALVLDVHNDYEYAIQKLASYAGRKGNMHRLENCSFPIDITKIS